MNLPADLPYFSASELMCASFNGVVPVGDGVTARLVSPEPSGEKAWNAWETQNVGEEKIYVEYIYLCGDICILYIQDVPKTSVH